MMDENGNGEKGSGAAAGPGTVVAFHYDLYDGEAERIESSKTGDPVRFLYGEKGVLAALQDAFLGKLAGDDFSVTIPHEKAYGRRYPDRVRRVSRKLVDAPAGSAGRGKGPLRPGQTVIVHAGSGARSATVVKVGRFNVDVDTNHPLAGRDLTFDVRVVEVRPASASEIAHGHAHGPGGHEHHG